MPNVIIVGTQWGDEGKGKYVDYFAERAEAVVRYGGGHNAGHTVVVGGQQFILHILPSGILHPGVKCIIGNGCVVDPEAFLDEVEALRRLGVEVGDNLFLSDRAQLILPYHRTLEAISEARLGARRIGTTCRGIGPAYEDKVGRRGLRVGDLRHPEALRDKLEFLVKEKNTWIQTVSEEKPLRAGDIAALLDRFAQVALPHVADTSLLVYRLMREGRPVLFEGAQATLLDIDHGTYPYVTSSSATAGGACTGTGVSPKAIDHILGVTKAYITRVGEGPLPTEMPKELGELVRSKGAEFGASTGRPRRCGWFDSVVVRYALRVNGLDALGITKLDVLDGLEQIKVCTRYRYRGKVVEEFPGELSMLEQCEPEYMAIPGWSDPTHGVTKMEALPAAARRYLELLEQLCGVPVEIVSTGPERAATIVDTGRGAPLLERWFGHPSAGGPTRG